ncbi:MULTISPECIES: hypothetical protein [Mycobacteroides]|nr:MULTISPECIES: hypothetical protein [Mycobacteroides]MBN7389285.1 hypothetical protein [Mycobacteroides abscessus subsp. abscessus]MBN7419077.1 hypothetical protein [Mycobacteroides abscessus subsp. abscessus]TDZ91188.1 hypothetical protein CCUG62472_04447 [Mycobacteroides salmoniphilum]
MNVAGIDTPIELLATLLVVLGPIGVAAVPLYFATRRHRNLGSKMTEVKNDVKAIREQTENDHESNMRVDIDKVLSGITRIEMRQNQQANELQEVRKEVRRDIGGLREEMRTERTERAEADKQTRQMIQRRPH